MHQGIGTCSWNYLDLDARHVDPSCLIALHRYRFEAAGLWLEPMFVELLPHGGCSFLYNIPPYLIPVVAMSDRFNILNILYDIPT